jgi:hypothetical protein
MHIVGFLAPLQYEEKTDSNLEKTCRIPREALDYYGELSEREDAL